MKNSEMSGTEFGVLVTIGVVVIAVGTDLAGRLLYFLYGEGPYFCIGLILLAFVGVNIYVHSEFNYIQNGFEKEVEKKLTEYEQKVSNINNQNYGMNREMEVIRKSLESNFSICEKTIFKVEKLLEQKTPIRAVAESAFAREDDRNVQAAVSEMVGGGV